jgi:hypothetical protein
MSPSTHTRPLRKLFAALALAAVLAALAPPARAASLSRAGLPGGSAVAAWEWLLGWLSGFGTSPGWRVASGGERWPNSATAKSCAGVDPMGQCTSTVAPPPVTKSCAGVDPMGQCKSTVAARQPAPAG